jgi:Transposase DDE domain
MQTSAVRFEEDVWAALIARLGGAEGLERSAREHGALLRKRGVASAEDLLRLVLAYAPGGRSLRQVAAEAAARGISGISDVAWMKRFGGCGRWLMALVEGLLAKAGEGPAAGTSPPVRLVDGSRIEGPGDSAWRLHLCWDASRRRIADLALTPLSEGERLDRLPLQTGELRLADAGLPDSGSLSRARSAGAEVLVRLTWNSLRLLDEAGRPLDWLALTRASHAEGGLDMPVRVVKPRGRFEPVPMRLVIRPKPPQALERARKRARRAASKEQRTADPRTLACAEHLILITSLSPQAFPPERLCELYRVRWQIELAFKRLKSILRLDRLPAKSPGLAQAWIAAHLLLALMIEDTAAEMADSFP